MSRYTIVGAGPVGTVMALLLAQRGEQVRLIERRQDPRATPGERGRSINLALAARGLRSLEDAGVLRDIAPAMIAMPGRMLHDEHGALRFWRYGQNDSEVIHAIGREGLNRLLIEAAARQPRIELRFGQRCLDVDPARRRLQLHDERTASVCEEAYDCLLAADGAGSAVRRALVRQGLTREREEPLAHDYKELVIPALANAASAPAHSGAGTARGAHAFEPHALHIWPRGGYMLIALPNADGSFTATLFLPRDHTSGLTRQDMPDFAQLADPSAVRAFFAAQFGDAAASMPDLVEQFFAHPQSRLATLYCEGWHHDGVLLLGDAAHAIVPFHGQGLNCGLEDCRVLAALLARHEPGAAFGAFERERRVNTDAIAAMALENYSEMRDAVRDPRFAQRKALAAQLERALPDRFIPRYSMVMFHPEIPYAEARRRGRLQERLLDRLEHYGAGPLPDTALAQARRWLEAPGAGAP